MKDEDIVYIVLCLYSLTHLPINHASEWFHITSHKIPARKYGLCIHSIVIINHVRSILYSSLSFFHALSWHRRQLPCLVTDHRWSKSNSFTFIISFLDDQFVRFHSIVQANLPIKKLLDNGFKSVADTRIQTCINTRINTKIHIKIHIKKPRIAESQRHAYSVECTTDGTIDNIP